MGNNGTEAACGGTGRSRASATERGQVRGIAEKAKAQAIEVKWAFLFTFPMADTGNSALAHHLGVFLCKHRNRHSLAG